MKRSLAILFAVCMAPNLPGQTPSASSHVVPENLGLGLRQLALLAHEDPARLSDALGSLTTVMSDMSGRVVVNIYLDGSRTADEVSAELPAIGAEIIVVETSWRSGVISAAIPVARAVAIAQLDGVRSVALARRPMRRVGAVTAQSSVVHRARDVNTAGVVTAQGILGRNISVGLISDSFDRASGAPRANVAVASGDLPGPGNPNGFTEPVFVLFDNSDPAVTDEGRAMAEVVHDIAPAARLSFATAGQTQATMANAIRSLRTARDCDIIVDDISFSDEPFFSDGIIARAVDEVTTSNALPGKKVSYFSASGNNAGGYAADAKIISVAAGMAARGNLQLSQAPSTLYAGGFHNFGPDNAPLIGMTVTAGEGSGEEISFQWDDPFNTGGVTTDYNLLLFTAAGQYLGSLSGTDTNQATDQPAEIVNLAANTSYQLVISLRTSAPPVARHFRFVTRDGNLTGPFISNDTITIFGHAAAAGANCVGAYVYDNTPNLVAGYNSAMTNPPPGPYRPLLEDFNSVGGNMPFYFNAQGQRLATPEMRMKPEFAAADGVDTSFFPNRPEADYDNNGFPNFFGTSAAAPNAAGIAALLLEAAGGPASLTPAQVRTILRQSALAHDIDPHISQATGSNAGATVQVRASGDSSNASAESANFFTLTFTGGSNERLSELVIDLNRAGLVFDPSTELGAPFVVGENPSGVAISSNLSSDSRMLTLSFGDTFPSGASITFGIDRDFAGLNAAGNAADVLAGASFTSVVSDRTIHGGFVNQLGAGFSPVEGYGFIDASAAVQQVLATPALSGIAANLSTRGFVGTGDGVLIGGVIINGSAAKKVILRAIGPTLPVAPPLLDPTLELVDANGQTFTVDNWQDDSEQAAQIQAAGFAPNDPRESALVRTLSPGGYTAIVRGAGDTTGNGLIEVYDADAQPPASLLGNISTRGNVRTGDDVLIAGFILTRATSQVVARAAGPSLAALGVAGFLPDPSVELYDAQGNVLGSNDNWQEDSLGAMQIQKLGLAPADGLESALMASLNPAGYTLVVRGAHGTTGVALVEVYDLP